MADNENNDNGGVNNASDVNGSNNANGANGDPGKPPPVSPSNRWVILLGIYLIIMLFIGLYGLAALMTAETLQQAKDSEIQKITTALTNSDNNQSNTNKPVNANAANAAAVVNGNLNTNANSNTNTNTVANSNTNTNRTVTPVVNTAPVNTNTTVNANTDEKTGDGNKPPVTVPKNIIVTVFGRPYDLTGDGYVFWVVLFSGMMGAIIRCLYSFFRHLGIGDFSLNWTWFYLMLPFGGAVLSLVLYFVIRGGFYSSSLGNELSLNLFSFAALGALTGLFSENAMEKLKQVAESLLTPVEPKTGKPKDNDTDGK